MVLHWGWPVPNSRTCAGELPMTLAEVVRRWHGGGCLVGHSAQVGRSPPPPPPLLAKGFHFIMQVHIIIFHANLYNFHHNFLSHSPLLFSGLSVACATWRSISPKKLTPSEIFFKSFWDNQISFGDSDVLFWCRNWQSCEYIDTSAIVYRLTFCKDENFKVFKVQKATTHSYCWWKKSCTSW